MRIRHCLFKACLLTLGMASVNLHAQETYPNRPIKFVIPFAPGGVTDLTGRTFAKYVSEALKQPLITENKPGAGALIGANYVARAPSDGYTMLLGTNVTHAINPQLMASTPYDPIKDFQPVAMFGLNGNVLVVNASFPANDFDAFIKYVKQKPGDINYASGSVGSSAHLAAELLKQEVKGLDYMHVPYNGPFRSHLGLDRRPRGLHVRQHRGGDHPDQVRKDQGHRGHHSQTRGAVAGRAHHRRVGRARIRGRGLDGCLPAERRAARSHDTPEPSHQ